MHKMIAKDVIEANMMEIMQDGTFYDFYNRTCESDDLTLMEEASARVFNVALFACQLIEDKSKIKNVMLDLLREADSGIGGTLLVSGYDDDRYLTILQRHDDYYLESGYEKMIERLKHGVAVHFTTPQIMEKMESDGYFRAYNSMFPKEVEEKIMAAQKYQMEHSEDALKSGRVLTQGFGFSRGISMAAQTDSFWMNHTPESLSFLFGGKMYTRNKEGAMEHVLESISTLPKEQQEEMLALLEHIWDDLVGCDKSLGCVLIDRDALEYEKVTYWNETPPRVEEMRPFRDNTLNSFSSIEDSRYGKDIPVSGLRFVKVPSIYQLEMYRKEHPIADADRIRQGIDLGDVMIGEGLEFSDESIDDDLLAFLMGDEMGGALDQSDDFDEI